MSGCPALTSAECGSRALDVFVFELLRSGCMCAHTECLLSVCCMPSPRCVRDSTLGLELCWPRTLGLVYTHLMEAEQLCQPRVRGWLSHGAPLPGDPSLPGDPCASSRWTPASRFHSVVLRLLC